mgnify:CR=1 FL=1
MTVLSCRWVCVVFFLGWVCFSACGQEQPSKSSEGGILFDLPGENKPFLLFEEVDFSRATERSIRMWNSSSSLISIDRFVLAGPDAAFFQIEFPKTPLVLLPDSILKHKLVVRFSPKEVRSYQAHILLETDAKNADQRKIVIQLSYKLVSRIPKFHCGEDILFRLHKLDETVKKSCAITNEGEGPLEIRKIEYHSDNNGKELVGGVWSGTLPLNIAPGGKETFSFSVSYQMPFGSQFRSSGKLVLYTNIPGETSENRPFLRVKGEIKTSLIEVTPLHPRCEEDSDCKRIDSRLSCRPDPASKDKMCGAVIGKKSLLIFSYVGAGSSESRQFRIRSVGNVPLKVSGFEITSRKQEFRVSNPGLPMVLEPGKSKTIEVVYRSNSGLPDPAVLVVKSNASNLPQAEVLLVPSKYGCDLQPSVRKIKFRSPRTLPLHLENRGNLDCFIHSISIQTKNPESFSIKPYHHERVTVPPGGKITRLVKFTLRGNRSPEGKIVITSSDPTEPIIEVPLSVDLYIHRDCELKATPAELDFKEVVVGETRRLRMGITNAGWRSCIISSMKVVVASPEATVFRIENKKTMPFTLSSGASIRLDFVFSPLNMKPLHTGELKISSNDSSKPTLTIKLKGKSARGCLKIMPSMLDFGQIKFGCAAPNQQVKIFHTGKPGCPSEIRLTAGQCVPTACFPKEPKNEFQIRAMPKWPVTLTPGKFVTAELSYKPVDLGVDTTSLELRSDAPGESILHLPVIGEGAATSYQKDVFKQKAPSVDVLFVLDDSPSMKEKLPRLSKSFSSFIQTTKKNSADFQIAVSTMDISGKRFYPGCFRCGEKACSANDTKIITQKTVDAATVFAKNVAVGTFGNSGKGFEAVRHALTNVQAGCNGGFVRKDAMLSIVFVSDRKELSSNPISYYLHALKSYKSGPRDQFHISAIVGPAPKGCGVSKKGAVAAPRYLQLVKDTGGIAGSICNKDWSSTLSKIGALGFSLRSIFLLSRIAEAQTIQVKINGNTIPKDSTKGWWYNPLSNSVHFSPAKIPPAGALIEINYRARCLR